jgi:hypothetical protein
MNPVSKPVFLVLCTLCFVAHGQTNDPKQSFIKAIDGKLRILSESWSLEEQEHGEQRYWTVHTEPLSVGTYSVIYSYSDLTRPHRSERYDHPYVFAVGPRGTRRIHTAYDPARGGTKGTHPEACLGDRVSFVFDLNPHYLAHTWRVDFQPAAEQDAAPIQNAPGKVPPNMTNTVDGYLRCTASEEEGSLGRSATLIDHFVKLSFEAMAPTNLTFFATLLPSPDIVAPALDAPIPAVSFTDSLYRIISRAEGSQRRYYPQAWSTLHAGSSLRQMVRVAIIPKDSLLDLRNGPGPAQYSREYGSKAVAWPGDTIVLRVGDLLKVRLRGECNDASRILCESLPLLPQ